MSFASQRTMAVLSLAALAWVALPAPAQTYRSEPGKRELTGELIVRPLRLTQAIERGLSLDRTMRMLRSSRERIAAQTVRYQPGVDFYVVRVPRGKTETKYAAELRKTGEYDFVHPNWRVFPALAPNDPRYGEQYHHRITQADLAWNLWTGSDTFVTAFVDTGVLKTHEDLSASFLPGYNSASRVTEANGGDVNDVNGHGTHVSGCGSAIGNNGVGVSGVGWNFKIIPVRASNSSGGGAPLSDLLDGAQWAADNGAKTVSVSYSGVDAEAVGAMGTYLRSIDAILLWAAGNDNRNLSGFQHADTIVVGASDSNDAKAGFSAYGRGCTLFAPGVNILSTTRNGGYGFSSGTSMAAPVANGVTSLIWSANPALTNDDVRTILFNTCDPIGSPSIFGFGRVNARRGVEAALASAVQSLDLGAVEVQSGVYARGDILSVHDADLDNSYVVRSSPVRRLGAVAGAQLTSNIPLMGRTLANLRFEAMVANSSGTPGTIMAHAYNFTRGQWESVRSTASMNGEYQELLITFNANASDYVNADGDVRFVLRSIIPQRFGNVTNELRIGHALVKYMFRPQL